MQSQGPSLCNGLSLSLSDDATGNAEGRDAGSAPCCTVTGVGARSLS
jgi:hypothetical protein